MKEGIDDREAEMEKEHNSLKLQMKGILRHVKEKIKSEASAMKPAAKSPTSPGRQAKSVLAKEKLRDNLWKLNKNADGSKNENWRERLCVLTSNGEFKYVSLKSKADDEDSGSFTAICFLPGFYICAFSIPKFYAKCFVERCPRVQNDY